MTSVIHSIIHMPESIRDFRPLQNYSTFNFESVIGIFEKHTINPVDWITFLILITLGSIVQSVSGPNVVTPELVNNINILQAATEQIVSNRFNSSLRIFITCLLSSKRQALPKLTSTDTRNSVRLGPKFQLPQNHVVMKYLAAIYLMPVHVYETCWENNIRFSTYNPTSVSQNCDSCLLFKNEKNEICCGFIAAIVCHPKEKCRMVINQIQINHRDSLILPGRCIINPYIFWGHSTDFPKFVLTPLKNIIVKLAYKKEGELFHFFQFPNTVEST